MPPLMGNNGSNGIGFNIKALNDIIIKEIWNSFASTSSYTVTVWYKTDSIFGQPAVSAGNGWLQMGTATFAPSASGYGTMVQIPATFNLNIPAGKTYGFFIDPGSSTIEYTNGGTGVQDLFADQNMYIFCGTNVGYGGPITGPTNYIREFNGKIGYVLGKKGANNASANLIANPAPPFCPGTQNVSVRIKNTGVNQISSAKVYWEVDGISQGYVTYSNLLDTLGGSGNNTAIVSLGNVLFAGSPHKIRAFTSLPNGITDTVNNDDTVTVNLGPSPTAIITPVGTTIFCTAGVINAVLNAPTGVGNGYQWKLNGSPIPGAIGSSFTATQAGDYSITIDSNGCTNTSATIRVDNLAMPLPLVTPNGYPVLCDQDSVTLNANAGVTGAGYQWQLQGNPIPGATNSSYVAYTPGNYTVVTSKLVCNATSEGVNIIPKTRPTPFIQHTITNGKHILTADASFVSYQWYISTAVTPTPTPLPGETNFVLIPKQNGNYSVTVSNGGCDGFSDTAQVTDFLSINSTGNIASIRIYPNPAENSIHINAPAGSRIVITSVDGKALIEQVISKNDINISNLANGIYLVKIMNGNNNLLYTDKLIKR